MPKRPAKQAVPSQEPIVRNVQRCSLCGSPMDRYEFMLQCRDNPAHVADLMTGICSDLTLPE